MPDGATAVLGEATLEELRQSLEGALLTPADPGYEEARRVWNGAIDRRPAAIARCTSPGDVVQAVRFARSERLLVAVRGGGHNVAGHGTCDGGLVIDLSPMRRVEVDPVARLARVGGGALWGDVDGAAQAHGLGTTGGLISTTGVGGLVLGGGIGWLMRKHGLSCDNLVAAEVVTADGTLVRASEQERPDLLWALRGGGGNFGVVTSFELRLHPVGEVLSGVAFHPAERAREILRGYREVAPGLPDELTTLVVMATAPPSPELPADLHGRRVLAIPFCFAGPRDRGEAAVAPLRSLGRPLFERAGMMPYAAHQRLQDPSAPAGLGNYWKSDHLAGLDDGVIDAMVDAAASATSPLSMLHLYQLGGAVARVPAGATAYPHRAAPYLLSLVALWPDAREDLERHAGWARQAWRACRPYATGAYVNFLGEEEPGRVRDAYGAETWTRLARLKARYDPTNLFRLNQNVPPAAEEER